MSDGKKKWVVWCLEYPDDGAAIFEADTAAEAVEMGRYDTPADLMGVCEATPEVLAEADRDDA